MNKRYIANAFSLNMLSSDAALTVTQLDETAARAFAADATSVVGHADTAGLFTSLLGTPVANNRATLVLVPGDEVLVGQLVGPRLPEGSTTLPPGARVEWRLVTLK